MIIRKSQLLYSIILILVMIASFVRGFSSSVFGSSKGLMIAMVFVFVISLYIVINNHISLKRIDLLWFVLLFINIFWTDASHPLQYRMVFLGAFSLSYALRKNINAFNLMLELIVLFSIISVIATWIELIFPALYNSLILPLFPVDTQTSILIQYKQGRMCGLAYHYSPNAFYVLNGCFVLIARVFTDSKRKAINLFFIVIELATLFSIGKRGHLLFFAIAVFVAYMLIQPSFYAKVKKSLKLIIIAGIAIILILKFVPQASFLLERISEQSQSNDITTGRTGLYALAFSLFLSSPVIGIKIGAFRAATGMKNSGVHNDYLQMLCETGIVGFLVYMITNIWMFVSTLNAQKRYWKVLNDNKRCILLYCIMFQIFMFMYSFTGLPHFDYEINTIYLLLMAVPYAIKQGEIS